MTGYAEEQGQGAGHCQESDKGQTPGAPGTTVSRIADAYK